MNRPTINDPEVQRIVETLTAHYVADLEQEEALILEDADAFLARTIKKKNPVINCPNKQEIKEIFSHLGTLA